MRRSLREGRDSLPHWEDIGGRPERICEWVTGEGIPG